MYDIICIYAPIRGFLYCTHSTAQHKTHPSSLQKMHHKRFPLLHTQHNTQLQHSSNARYNMHLCSYKRIPLLHRNLHSTHHTQVDCTKCKHSSKRYNASRCTIHNRFLRLHYSRNCCALHKRFYLLHNEQPLIRGSL